MSYQFHPAAEKEHLETVTYYELQQRGLGAFYLAEFESAMEAVCANPNQYPILLKPEIRRKLMKRFPFSIFFREAKGVIQILAVAHQRRRPEYWIKRL